MTEAPIRTVSLTVGTAGHIDHGKTALVTLLTGCNTDTLPEEKARGMTIDLGFATCVLSNNRRVGIVDVPGHERFIHNMVAGAAGIDVVLLVVAADDGVMPQTIEHFHIVRLLGVAAGLVALTKIDLVDAARIAEVTEQVRALTAGSFLAEAPIMPISPKTAEGFDAFYEAFSAVVDRTAERDAGGPFRMHVERTFVLQGIGTIVSGIPRSGRVHMGDELELLPQGDRKKVRGIHVYGETAEEGRAGECVALRLADLRREDVGRGHVLATPGHFAPSRFVSARFQLLSSAGRALAPRTAIRLHAGTADLPGHLVLPTLDPLAPGGESYVQLQLHEPLVAALGDPFVVRQLNPVRTLGGGYIVGVEESKIRRSHGDWAEGQARRDAAFRDPVESLAYVLDRAGDAPQRQEDLARQAMLTPDAAAPALRALVEAARATELPGGRVVRADTVARARERVAAALAHLHDEAPLAVGFPRTRVLSGLRLDHAVLERALDEHLASGEIVETPAGLQARGRAPALSAGQSALAARVGEAFRTAGFASPRRDELPALLGVPSPVLDPVVGYLLQSGELAAIDERIVLHRDAVERSRQVLEEHIRAHGSLDSGKFKDLLGTTRKYAIPLLEYWDKRGLTRRVGNERVLR